MLFKKAGCIILFNKHGYWKDPLINRYLGTNASEDYEGLLVLRSGAKPMWISHPFNYSQARKVFARMANVKTYSTQKQLRALLQKSSGKTVGYNAMHLSVAHLSSLKKLLPNRKFVDVSAELEKSREIKTREEVAKLSKAAKATKQVLVQAEKWLKKGITEKQLGERIMGALQSKGFGIAFCQVSFGANTTHLHHTNGETKLSSGAVMIDCGAKCEGYCSDTTRTYWFGARTGKAYEEFAKVEEKVLKCAREVEALLREGTSVKALWRTTKALGKFPHALGHGIGLEEHDLPPGIGEKSNWKLKEGMVLAIEPAIYGRKFGYRHEDDYLITKKSFRKL